MVLFTGPAQVCSSVPHLRLQVHTVNVSVTELEALELEASALKRELKAGEVSQQSTSMCNSPQANQRLDFSSSYQTDVNHSEHFLHVLRQHIRQADCRALSCPTSQYPSRFVCLPISTVVGVASRSWRPLGQLSWLLCTLNKSSFDF